MSKDADWIEWTGGECPVAPETIVEAETGDGARYEGRADQFMRGRWEHDTYFLAHGMHIIAYRVVQP